MTQQHVCFGIGVALMIMGISMFALDARHKKPVEEGIHARWLSEQLSKGNHILGGWEEYGSRDTDKEALAKTAAWESETQEGLAKRLPEYEGYFGVEGGLGREFAQFAYELHERTSLRRRIQRLKEIMDRYEQGRGKRS